MCQYEETLSPYEDVAKAVYKSLVRAKKDGDGAAVTLFERFSPAGASREDDASAPPALFDAMRSSVPTRPVISASVGALVRVTAGVTVRVRVTVGVRVRVRVRVVGLGFSPGVRQCRCHCHKV